MRLRDAIGRPGTARSRGERLVEAAVIRLMRITAGSTQRRVLIWNSMRRTLESGFSVREAVETAIDAAPKDGSRRMMLRRWQYAYADGDRAFAAEVSRWVPSSEGMIFGALGEGNATGVFAAAARVAEVSQILVQAIRRALVGPGVTLAITLVIVWGSGGFVLPTFRKLSDPEKWTTLGQIGYAIATGLYEYDIAILVALAALVAGVWIAVLRWTGGMRRRFDDYVPFSLYRLISGSAFLMMVLELMKLGVDLNDTTWARLSERASPYVRSRIEAIQERMVRGGMGLGRAMRAAGTGFPDYELVAVGAAMDGRPGWNEEMSKFLERWLQESEASIKAMATGANVMMNVMCAFLVVLVMSPAMQSFMHLRKIGS